MKIYDVLGNSQSLDGGAMFGNAPKALWSRWYTPDEENRIQIACRAVLVDTGEKRVLLETGIGAFFEPHLKERYGVVEDDHVLLSSLQALGYRDADIDAVILSHLHFDHAGGLLSPYADGQGLSLLFPNAQFIVGAAAFERAEHPHPRDRASFIPQLPQLLQQTGRLELLAEDAEQSSLGAQFRFHRTHGHTPGMLHTRVCGEAHEVFFCADLIPGSAWVHAPVTMGYDRFPEQLIDEKTALLTEFEAQGTWLYFTHDPKIAAARVAKDAKGKFTTKDARPTFQAGWDLDVA